jgi:hypothetical protein
MTSKRIFYGSASALAIGIVAALSVGSVLATPASIMLPGEADAQMSQAAPFSPYENEFGSLGTDDGDFSECDGECYEEPEPEPELEEVEREPDRSDDRPSPVSTGQTDVIVTALDSSNLICDNYLPEERIDCLREQFHRIAQAVPSSSEYDDLRQALSIAASELNAVVRENADATATPTRRTVDTPKGPRTSSSRIRPIAPERLATANAQATEVLDKLSTKLLRSASSSASKRVHYERAAQAINSSKVLLRSA